MIQALRYHPSMQREWDDFVARSTNATFLHLRGYMDYHSDRFTDSSIVVRDSRSRIMALLPANIEPSGTVCSHRGLTYGGLLVGSRHHSSESTLRAWDAILSCLHREGAKRLIIKPVPHIYSSYPSDDDIYALWRSGAVMVACRLSSAIPLDQPLLFNQGTKADISRARRSGIAINFVSDIIMGKFPDFEPLPLFWPLLENVLSRRHGASPVHSIEEMQLLQSRFPKNILTVLASDNIGDILGGMVIYIAGPVAHVQYIAISDAGRRNGALASLTAACVGRFTTEGLKWFDFGTSCEDGGRILNAGLNAQKYGMGGRPVAYTTWSLNL